MIPLSDDNPTMRTPLMTYVILAVTIGTWLLVQGGGFNSIVLASSVCNFGMVPAELTHLSRVGVGVPIGPNLACVVDDEPINKLTPVLSMFLHGGWMHLLGNCLFFWVFGNNVEDSMGRVRFVVFYLVCGIAAAAAHIFTAPASIVPTVGASGAISGILGAYLVLYPRVRVNMLFIFVIFIRVIALPAWAVLLWWFGWQLLSAVPQLNALDRDVSGGVAVWAHVGGFIAGIALVKLFVDPSLVRRRTAMGDANAVWGHGTPPT